MKLNDNVIIKTKTTFTKLPKDQITAFSRQNLDSVLPLNDIVRNNRNENYMIGNVLVTLRADKGPYEPDRLQLLKKAMDGSFIDRTKYRSEIQQIGNKYLLITSDVQQTIQYYMFCYMDSSRSYLITGSMQFKETEDQQARSVLQALVKSTSFK